MIENNPLVLSLYDIPNLLSDLKESLDVMETI